MANDTTSSQPGVLDTLSSWMKSLGGIVTAGTDAYAAVSQRINAIDKINEDTVKATAPAASIVAPSITSKLPSWVIPAAVAAGVVILILVVRKMR